MYLDYVKDEGLLFRVDKYDSLEAQLAGGYTAPDVGLDEDVGIWDIPFPEVDVDALELAEA